MKLVENTRISTKIIVRTKQLHALTTTAAVGFGLRNG